MRRGDGPIEDFTWLGPASRRKIVEPAPLEAAGPAGRALWYAIEQESRQYYFQWLLANQSDIESQWLEIEGPLKAEALTKLAPELENLLSQTMSEELPVDEKCLQEVETLLETAHFNCQLMAEKFVEAGRRLG